MEGFEKRLRAYGRGIVPEPDESKIKDTVVSARNAFWEKKQNMSYWDFLYEQTRYIRKRWWGLQLFVLFLTGVFVHEVQDVQLVSRMFGITASLFVILVIPELWKNRSSNAMEVEGAAYFSIRQIYSARLLVFAAVDGVLLTFFTAGLSMTGKVIIGELIIQFFLPMTVTCCICFRSLCSRFAESEYAACFLSLLWTAVWIRIVLSDIYPSISGPVWAGCCGLTVLYLTYTVRRILREKVWFSSGGRRVWS